MHARCVIGAATVRGPFVSVRHRRTKARDSVTFSWPFARRVQKRNLFRIFDPIAVGRRLSGVRERQNRTVSEERARGNRCRRLTVFSPFRAFRESGFTRLPLFSIGALSLSSEARQNIADSGHCLGIRDVQINGLHCVTAAGGLIGLFHRRCTSRCSDGDM